jgi:alpha-glucuronidase
VSASLLQPGARKFALVLGVLLTTACSSSDEAPGTSTGGNAGTGGAGGSMSGGASGLSGSAGGAGAGSGGSAAGSSSGGASSGSGGSGGAAPSGGAGGTGGSSGSTGGAVSAGGSAGAGGGGGSSGGGDEPYPKPTSLADETGASLWLRYPVVPIPGRLAEYQAALKHVVKVGTGSSLDSAEDELLLGLAGLTGATVDAATSVSAASVVVGTATDAPIKDLPLAARLAAVGSEGYLVETAELDGQALVVVAGNTPLGALYGSFALLRHLASHRSLAGLALESSPRIQHRLLNHWDNPDRTVERGYAGRSLWDWNALPATISERYRDYARANASLGINGAVLNNVNANAQMLTASYLTKVKALADTFRPYGIRVYLTARFSAPIEIGGLATADPNDSGVRQWWADKADEIYAQIDDFGGFLVKANSEGQPGPQDYGRSHADGANMLAEALAPHGGLVMWRAFVYSDETPVDRIKQAYDEFQPLDGAFESNVLVQAKNGPLDFQPREPFHPLFGAMPETPLALELQITKEYLGEDTHLAYLGPLFEEVLQADTGRMGAGSTVAKVIDGSLHGYTTTAIAGVANVGDDVNWTGSHMNQANWYAFGRLAWNPDLSAEGIADEWVRQTFSNDPLVVAPVVELMMGSRQTLVDYMTPLGLVHIMGSDHHYGPAPWVDDLGRADWNPVYYHRADEAGLGFDRSAGGTDAVAQYSSAVGSLFGARSTVPDDYLLFFHHVGWQETLASGRSLWEELVHRYSRGVDEVGVMRTTWAGLDGYIDARRFADVEGFLEIQHYEARWWRDACLTYFGTHSGSPIPAGYAPAANALSFYQGLDCPSNAAKPRCDAVYTGNPSPAILP